MVFNNLCSYVTYKNVKTKTKNVYKELRTTRKERRVKGGGSPKY